MQSEKIGKINQIGGAFKGCQSVEISTGRESAGDSSSFIGIWQPKI